MLGGQDFEKMVLKMFEIRSEELENLLSGLATTGDSFFLFDVFNLE